MNTIQKKITKLNALKEAFDTQITNQYQELRREELNEEIKNFPLVSLKALWESVCDKVYDNPDTRKHIAKYVTTISESKELKTAFNLVNETYKKHLEPDTKAINEAFYQILGSIDSKKLSSDVKELANIVAEAVTKNVDTVEELEKLVKESNNELNESMDYLFTNKLSTKNMSEFAHHSSVVNRFINENVMSEIVQEIDEENGLDELNKKLSEATEEWEREVIIDYSRCVLANENKEELFETYKTKCINKINEQIDDEDIETKSRLLNMRERLDEKVFSPSTCVEDLLKLSELTHSL